MIENKRAHYGSMLIGDYSDLMQIKMLALDNGLPEISKWAEAKVARIIELEREVKALKAERGE